MNGLGTSKGPSAKVVIPHYAFASFAFLVLSILLCLTPDIFIGHYFHPKLLAITHIAALAWGSMVVFGALYQFLPVILEKPLYSEMLAIFTLFLFSGGVVLLIYSFWNFFVGIHIQIASAIICFSLVLFAINVFCTASKITKWNIETEFIVTAIIWLLLTAVIGALMAFNFSFPFLPKSHLLFLKLHAHSGIVGWFLLLIMGVASKLIPMFLLSTNLNKKKLNYSFYLTNIGLIGFLVHAYLNEEKSFSIIYALIIITGIYFFISYLYEAYKKRIRKQLDIGLKHSFLAIVIFIFPIIAALIIAINPTLKITEVAQLILFYGASIFLGFVSSLILGQTFKTLPFIVWLHLYKNKPASEKTLLPKDLYSDKLVFAQFLIYFAAIIVLLAGILFSSVYTIQVGAILFLITAVFYNINVVLIIYPLFKK